MDGLSALWSYRLNVLDDVNQIYMDIRVRNKNEPMATKTKLAWVILGKRQNTNKNASINAFLKKFDPENMV